MLCSTVGCFALRLKHTDRVAASFIKRDTINVPLVGPGYGREQTKYPGNVSQGESAAAACETKGEGQGSIRMGLIQLDT